MHETLGKSIVCPMNKKMISPHIEWCMRTYPGWCKIFFKTSIWYLKFMLFDEVIQSVWDTVVFSLHFMLKPCSGGFKAVTHHILCVMPTVGLYSVPAVFSRGIQSQYPETWLFFLHLQQFVFGHLFHLIYLLQGLLHGVLKLFLVTAFQIRPLNLFLKYVDHKMIKDINPHLFRTLPNYMVSSFQQNS